jgi:hypothetical protein
VKENKLKDKTHPGFLAQPCHTSKQGNVDPFLIQKLIMLRKVNQRKHKINTYGQN